MAQNPILQRVVAPIESLGQKGINGIEALGRFGLLVVSSLIWVLRPPYRYKLLLQQLEFVGVGSLPIVMLTGIFTGMVFALQSAYAFGLFNAEALVGSTVTLALSRELAPVLTALMVSGRVGSAMATELGTMRVTEQIDALETMAVNPVQYLIVPRVLATVIMMPILVMLFILVGSIGSYVVAVIGEGLNPGTYLARLRLYVDPSDLIQGCVKGGLFGFVIAYVGCYRGYYAHGGARGVGIATTGAVVGSSVVCLILDYFATAAFF